jgi:hypothetical protein
MPPNTDRIEKKIRSVRRWIACGARSAMRWYPFDEESGVDYSREPWTLVEFRLEEVAGGTMLTITESGFDAIPLEQRAKALTSHEQGWATQGTLIEKYLAMAA